MTPAQAQEFEQFFEHTRLMRWHQLRYQESRHTDAKDKEKALYYQRKVDQYIKHQVKLQRTKQEELF